ncbi:hypothetical protein LBMAG56_08800 [Verrucomicrobiota bacterium]|nr:hypothetical protein LBMAG56_08800 [Verrucomicrobiota bacterium]
MPANTTSQPKPRFGELPDQVLPSEGNATARQAAADLRANRALITRRRKGRRISERDIRAAIATGRR